jgi:hypothetical protein
VVFRPDIIEEVESIVRRVQENLKAAKSRQETYANKRCRPLEFKVGRRYIGPFPILKKCGTVAYKLDLPPSLAGVHNIFHMSQLKKCLKAPVDIMLLEVTPLEADLSYPEYPIKVLDRKDRVTRYKRIKFFKI